ncbi:MAG: CBS domain-containing protein [Polaribacter sp.]|jgi:CBS domain-containing protein|nr:CBS domain-containing protein [Polaribacter sp.]MDG1955349.1 CBS domain-containing protein [Polaribacter sp.]MDG2073353.1 CBS domain-containing protein [Polaribacter sp.]
MKRRELVSKIMSTELITLNQTNNLVDAEKLFKEYSIRHIPVVSGQDIIGMLSLTDLLRITFVDDYNSEDNVDTAVYSMLSIEQVMVKNLVSVKSTQTIKEIVEILAKNEFHALPVLDNHKLVGIVTTTDILNYLLEQY